VANISTGAIYRGILTPEKVGLKILVVYCGIILQHCHLRANVLNLFAVVIYYHSTIIPSCFVIKQIYQGNYHGKAVHYPRIVL